MANSGFNMADKKALDAKLMPPPAPRPPKTKKQALFPACAFFSPFRVVNEINIARRELEKAHNCLIAKFVELQRAYRQLNTAHCTLHQEKEFYVEETLRLEQEAAENKLIINRHATEMEKMREERDATNATLREKEKQEALRRTNFSAFSAIKPKAGIAMPAQPVDAPKPRL